MNLRHDMQRLRSSGFTLIELLIALVIVGVVAGYAISSYTKSIQKSNRALAKTTLTRIANGEENFRFSNNRYTTSVTTAYGTALASQVTQDYTVTIAASASTYSVSAVAAGPQLKDTDCKTFRLDSLGVQTAWNSAGSTSSSITTNCWGG